MKKVLVTGSSGFIGTRIAASYAQEGCSVLGIDVRVVPHIAFPQQECDLLAVDMVSLLRDFAPELVIHCAGNANVGISVARPHFDFDSNVKVLHRLLFAIKDSGLRPKVIFMSSAAVYGNPLALPIRETDVASPISPYGLHKRQCEDLCEYFHRVEGLPIHVVRIFSAYGSGLRKQLFWDLAGKIANNPRVELFGTGNETRDFIHVDDVVGAIALVAERSDCMFYNLANGVEVSIREAAGLLAQAMGKDASIIGFNGKVKPGDPLNWRADISALLAIGYRPRVGLAEGLQAYAEWVKKDVH